MGVNEYVGIFGSEMGYTEMEKRQLFLRSYQFSRKKKSLAERIKGSFFRVKRAIRIRIGSARKLRKVVWFRLGYALCYTSRGKRFLRFQNNNRSTHLLSWTPSCFC